MLPYVQSLVSKAATRSSIGVALVATVAIALGTLVIAILEQATEIPDASAVYLVAVVVVGSIGGTVPAVITAVASFLVYDLLFTEPRFSLAVTDTSELLNLVLVLIVALAVGRLAALGRERAAEADRRAVEATGLFAVSRLLATADSTEEVAGPIVDRLAREAGLTRVWIKLEGAARERILADTGEGPLPSAPIVTTLVRTPGDESARWVRAHEPLPPGVGSRHASAGDLIRVRIETGGSDFGSLWAVKPGATGSLDAEATRLLSLAADQLALGGDVAAFETMHRAVLYPANDMLFFYTWGDDACVLCKGSTRATLKDGGTLATRLLLRRGDLLVFEERLGPHARRREVEEVGRGGVDGILELAAPEKREHETELRHDVDVDARAVARLALLEVVRVEVDACAEFGEPGVPASRVFYRAMVVARASENTIRELILHTDRIAEIHNTLRAGRDVVLRPWE
jgi:hypothetical protein